MTEGTTVTCLFAGWSAAGFGTITVTVDVSTGIKSASVTTVVTEKRFVAVLVTVRVVAEVGNVTTAVAINVAVIVVVAYAVNVLDGDIS